MDPAVLTSLGVSEPEGASLPVAHGVGGAYWGAQTPDPVQKGEEQGREVAADSSFGNSSHS